MDRRSDDVSRLDLLSIAYMTEAPFAITVDNTAATEAPTIELPPSADPKLNRAGRRALKRGKTVVRGKRRVTGGFR